MHCLFFIIPFVSITLMVSMRLILKHRPFGISINIGKLHTEDIYNLSENQRNDLSKKCFIHFLLVAICTALIGLLFIINGYGGDSAATAIAVLVCDLIQFIIGWILIHPLLKKAKLLKLEIDKNNLY